MQLVPRVCWSRVATADTGLPVRSTYDLVWAGECRLGGHLSVADAWMGPYQYRMLKYEHSLLGGVYTHPKNVTGQSIYGAFYLQVSGWARCKCVRYFASTHALLFVWGHDRVHACT